jgi:hypothetical protein
LLSAILTAEPEVFGGVAGLLKPGGKLTVVLSVVETDSVDGVRRLEDRTVAALCQRISGVCPDLTDHTYRTATAADIAAAHSTWAKRLRAGPSRPAWLLEFGKPYTADKSSNCRGSSKR